MAMHTRPGGCFYVAHADINSAEFRKALVDAKIHVSQSLIWIKSSAVLSRNDYNWKHEPILYGWREGAAHYFCEDFTLTTVIEDPVDLQKMAKDDLIAMINQLLKEIPTTIFRENRPQVNDLHPTMKPIGLVASMIGNSTSEFKDEIVLDAFGGSGTTLMAAEQLGRCARLVELDERYNDVIVKRWEQFTGKTAEKEEA
jgi:site-specific DNA-methyltransferase (adenine-specific)